MARLVQAADADIDIAVEDYRAAAVSLALAAARAATSLAQELYAAGARPLLQTLDAQRAQVLAEDAVLLARQAALAETIGLYRALGGGFEPIELDGTLTTDAASEAHRP